MITIEKDRDKRWSDEKRMNNNEREIDTGYGRRTRRRPNGFVRGWLGKDEETKKITRKKETACP